MLQGDASVDVADFFEMPAVIVGFPVVFDEGRGLVDEQVFAQAGDGAIGGKFIAPIVARRRGREDFGDQGWIQDFVSAIAVEYRRSGDHHLSLFSL